MLEVNKNINLRGEMALSHSSPDARRSDVEKKFDDAFKAAVDLKDEMYESTTEYSRIGPNFNTTGGFSASDLESLLYDGLFYLPWDVTLIHYVHMDADNLKKTKSTTTKQINPGLKASFKLPFGLKTDLGWDMRKRYSTDRITGELTNVYSSGISKDLTICYLNARFSRTVVENYKQPEQDRARNSILVGLDGDFEVRGVRFSWDLSEDLQLEQYPKIGSCKQDFLMTHSGGLKTVFPSTLTLDGRISFNDNNYYINSTDSHVNKYHFSISRDLIKDLIISFNYDQNDYYYAGGDGNYFEIVMAGKINLRF